MPTEIIQWYPGHMAKAKREMSSMAKNIDIVFELQDARAPISTENPDIKELFGDKPILKIFNKASLADPVSNKKLEKMYQNCVVCDCIKKENLQLIIKKAKQILSDKIERKNDKGYSQYTIKAIIVGVPNVGKSTLINVLSSSNKLKTENKPGVTKCQQWIHTSQGIDFLDTPGVLWPKFETQKIGINLALIGSIKKDVILQDELAMKLCEFLSKNYTTLFFERYKLDVTKFNSSNGEELLNAIAKKRGYFLSGNELDIDRASSTILNEFQVGKIGRITLDEV